MLMIVRYKNFKLFKIRKMDVFVSLILWNFLLPWINHIQFILCAGCKKLNDCMNYMIDYSWRVMKNNHLHEILRKLQSRNKLITLLFFSFSPFFFNHIFLEFRTWKIITSIYYSLKLVNCRTIEKKISFVPLHKKYNE